MSGAPEQPGASEQPGVPRVGEDETLDLLTRDLRLIQKRRGHRAASDDVFLAGVAARACPGATRVLDLGSGKGTVALLLLERLPRCRVVGVEALPSSHDLARRNAALNGLTGRYDPRLGDLRDPAVLANEPPFQLITGAPPFMPLGSGVLPRDEQRAAGRFELRGGVREYAAVAATHLAPRGRVVILMDGLAASRRRAVEALTAAGLAVRVALAVLPRPDQPPLYWVLQATQKAGPEQEACLTIRPPSGEAFSALYLALREELNLP